MAKCDYCSQEMTTARTCNRTHLAKKNFVDLIPKVRYGEEERYGGIFDEIAKNEGGLVKHRCHDCGIKIGGLHHAGCDVEECPKCHCQLISCDCGYLYDLDRNDVATLKNWDKMEKDFPNGFVLEKGD